MKQRAAFLYLVIKCTPKWLKIRFALTGLEMSESGFKRRKGFTKNEAEN